jgi:ParB family chromosome partitioning protein
MSKPKENAFAGAADIFGGGVDALFASNSDEYEALINVDDIEVVEQVREEFEDEENSLADLAASMKERGLLQAIVIRPIDGGPKPFRLIAGERRYRAATLNGWEQIRARVLGPMTDEEAEDAQLAENIHRKNLTQIEEAKKIQRDLDRLGSVEAVLEKHQKSRAWLSKVLSLLSLPGQTKRLVTENISADLEVINTVKTVEKADPQAAKELVDDLKQTRGKANARDKAAAAKEQVKPSKNPKAPAKGIVATTKDRSHEEPGGVEIFAGAKAGMRPMDALANAYTLIFESGKSPKMIVDSMDAATRDDVETWLESFYHAGMHAKNAARDVIQGFRNGQFATDGDGAFALVAFLQGADSEAKFSLLNVLGAVKE